MKSHVALILAGTLSWVTGTQASGVLAPASERLSSPDSSQAPSFRRHVVPLLSRIGCSSRECHGSFSGQGGFQLSLFGYDFQLDHGEITADEEEIRVDREQPARSLLLTKPTMEEKHKGKLQIEKDSWQYHLVLNWIRGGATNDAEASGDLQRLEVQPSEILFQGTNDTQQLRVIAHWQDGTSEDVTELTRFQTNDESIAGIDKQGRVEALGAGDTHIVAFYDNGVVPVPVLLPLNPMHGERYPKVATPTEVDRLVVAKLQKLGIRPSPVCSDTDFLRRVSLDVTGTLPTPSAIQAFLADRSPDKRERLIDQLLETPEHSAWWATRLCDITGNNAGNISEKLFKNDFSRQWYDWIYARLKRNEPYDQLVAGIVLATSRSSTDQDYLSFARQTSSYLKKTNPADFADHPYLPHFWARRNLRMPEEKALAFSHAFLGVRLQCAQCHKHPFDQWSKQDFEQFQAFFEPLRVGTRPDSKDEAKQVLKTMMAQAGLEGETKSDKKALDRLSRTRVERGEPIPWTEVYVESPKTMAKASTKKKPNTKRPTSSRVVTPKILGGEEVLATEYPDPREPLMEWLRDPQNPYFAKAFVNRVWAHYFGRGIVEPADDLNLANPPVNAPLMDHLAKSFIESGYDIRRLHREILLSDTYQRDWKPNETNALDDRNFSHMILRQLPAEVVVDAVAAATGTTIQAANGLDDLSDRAIGPNGQAGQNKRNRSAGYALSLFGQPPRETTCDCERTTDSTLLQTIYLRNDRDIRAALDNPKGGWIASLGGTANETEPNVAERHTKLRERLLREQQVVSEQEASADNESRKAQASVRRKRLEASMKKYVERYGPLTGQKPETAAQEAPLENWVREAFLRTVSRPPTEAELSMGLNDLKQAETPVDGLREILWALLNTKEFLVNH